MADFDAQSLGKVIAYIGERDRNCVDDLTMTLRQAGVGTVQAHSSLAALTDAVGRATPDLIILGDDFDPAVFNFIRDIRHSKVGGNPFVMVTTLVAPERIGAAKAAMQAGTDDIMVRPVKEDQVMQRLRRVATNRQAFVATSDYFGPDRRGKSRASSIRRIVVPNTFLDKAHGKVVQSEAVRSSVDATMIEVLQARMDSHGYRLSFTCNLINEAYETGGVSEDIKEKLSVLVHVLHDASRTARRLKDEELAILCGSLARQVDEIVGRYQTPTMADRELLRRITHAVARAVRARMPAEELKREAEAAAQVYRQRQRERFPPIVDLNGEDETPATHQAIEVLHVAKGEYLFREGEPATAAYIVAGGTVGIYKEHDGRRVPVAKVRKGEFFGEMAIVDGTPRRTTAIALEDTTLSLVAKDMIEQKMAAADPLIRSMVQMLIYSLRTVPDVYTPRSRHVLDSVREMQEQVGAITGYLVSPSAPADLKGDAEAIVTQLQTVTTELVALISGRPDLDRRTPALPAPHELSG